MMPLCDTQALIYLLSLILGHADPNTRPAMAPCEECTIPSLRAASMWFCITLLTLNIHCLNETFPFWVGSPLNRLNFGVFLLCWEATLEQDISCIGS